jgi:sugar O-acyltransferase (sialic acid O-acetyltransferase NeuD family)
MKTRKRILLWGGRSKARIIYQMLTERKDIESVTVFENRLKKIEFKSTTKHLKTIKELKLNLFDLTHFIMCLGGEHGYARVQFATAIEKLDLNPMSLIHPHSYIDSTSKIGAGVQVMPSATIHSFCTIGNYCIVNTNATIDHECVIGNGVHIMGAAAVAGRVCINDYATIGTNATILPNIRIGVGAFVGAGAVVTNDVEDYAIVIGSPAKIIRKNKFKISQTLLSQLLK